MLDHHQFEELASLAALGELSPEEHEEFVSHKNSCRECAQIVVETSSVAAATFLAGEPDLEDETAKRERHHRLRESIARGLPVVVSAASSQGYRRLVWAGIAAAFVVGASLGVIVKLPDVRRSTPAQTTAVVATPSSSSAPSSSAGKDELVRAQVAIADLEKRVQGLRADNLLLREKLAASDQGETVMNAKLSEMEKHSSDEDQQIVQLREDLNTAGSEATRSKALLLASQDRIETLQRNLADREARLTEASASLDREREMLSAGREIRDIMGARELHIVDVVDRDSKGRVRKAFGRAFYTQGKSLIFYAFDLPPKNTADGKFVYAAWGSNSNDPKMKAVRSLGIFYNDDQAQHRWAMKFDDPKTLEEIDTVFVTLEPANQPIISPTGKPILDAYFGTPPNHP